MKLCARGKPDNRTITYRLSAWPLATITNSMESMRFEQRRTRWRTDPASNPSTRRSSPRWAQQGRHPSHLFERGTQPAPPSGSGRDVPESRRRAISRHEQPAPRCLDRRIDIIVARGNGRHSVDADFRCHDQVRDPPIVSSETDTRRISSVPPMTRSPKGALLAELMRPSRPRRRPCVM